jgi:hypothetical protein
MIAIGVEGADQDEEEPSHHHVAPGMFLSHKPSQYHHIDLPALTREAAIVERSCSAVLTENRWNQSMPWLWKEGSLFESMREVLLILVL